MVNHESSIAIWLIFCSIWINHVILHQTGNTMTKGAGQMTIIRKLKLSRCIGLVAVCKCNRAPSATAMRYHKPHTHRREICNITPARGCPLTKHHLPMPMVKEGKTLTTNTHLPSATISRCIPSRELTYPTKRESSENHRLKRAVPVPWICDRSQGIWGFPKIMVPPNHPFLIGFSIINHPFWGTLIFGNSHMFVVGVFVSFATSEIE